VEEGDQPADETAAWVPLDAGSSLLPGRFDPTALLLSRCLRRAFFPALWLGAIGAASFRDPSDSFNPTSTDAASYVDNLSSPFAGLVFALALRVAANLVAFVLAYRGAAAHQLGGFDQAPATGWRSRLKALPDRMNLTRALRALRWTEPVQHEAARRLGVTGRRLELAERVIGLVGWGLFLLLIVAMFTTDGLVIETS